ncbi:flagellar biosynthesis protein FlhF [Acetonema longum]|uniref:flagellar biosynthesis protein FlhF n=1 Tax=Acetonema longum TaxID=2374 RepID=UPI001EE63B62|nr:flagellar biosynthesis protein FlhF [Acetonema longum]
MKVFTAANMQDAIAQVKNDLGRDAVILHTRKFRTGGVLGLFAKESVEVMAAVDNAPPQPVTPPVPLASSPVPAQPSLGSSQNSPILEKRMGSGLAAYQANAGDTANSVALQMEIANMRKMIEQMLEKMPKSEKQLSPLHELLQKNDVDAHIAEELLKGLPDAKSPAGTNPEVIRQLLLERVSSHFKRVDGIVLSPDSCKTVALIGPTGVGKTTTIAKLAASFAIKENFKVALVTADTYRIAAVEQLKIYADIIGVPLEIVYTPDELRTALHRHKDKNLVLVDTAGRSPKNQYQLGELQALLTVNPQMEVYLVLSATTKYQEALDAVNKFSVCSPKKFLFTKLDEASNLGTVFNLLYQFPASLSYVTTGQNVPDDIELADPQQLANLMLRIHNA